MKQDLWVTMGSRAFMVVNQWVAQWIISDKMFCICVRNGVFLTVCKPLFPTKFLIIKLSYKSYQKVYSCCFILFPFLFWSLCKCIALLSFGLRSGLASVEYIIIHCLFEFMPLSWYNRNHNHILVMLNLIQRTNTQLWHLFTATSQTLGKPASQPIK